jgi:tetratricopeptide (TPR) repeat protein
VAQRVSATLTAVAAPVAAPAAEPAAPVVERASEEPRRSASMAAALPVPTREDAAARLAEGDLAGAAELFARIGLDDEATHLWVDVLGEPARAARLLALRGNHERAAELYELAGDRPRAALAWVDAARVSTRPESFLERIAELAPDVALRYLEEELASRPLSAETAEWHYHKARTVDRTGDARRAITLYLELEDAVGSYRDVDERLRELTRAIQPPAVAGRTRRTTRAPIELPADGSEPPAPADAEHDQELSWPGEPAAASQVDRPAPVADVDHDQLRQLAAQVADAAVDQVRRRSRLSTLPATPAVVTIPPPLRSSPELRITGLEPSAASPPATADDRALEAVRRGPPLDALEYMAGGRPCDRGNVDVFYRIGLAHQAAGSFDDALASFTAVEEVVPGYRDAAARVEALRRWRQSAASAPLAGSEPSPTGERYELRGELGRGRTAVVYRAFDERLGRDVALKFLAPALASQPALRERFLRQAAAMAALGHPNLVAIHDSGTLAGRTFFAMELVDGPPIASLMREPRGLSIVEALRIMKQVFDGLGHLHGHGLIHRDVRPASIVRTASGLVKLMEPAIVEPAAATAGDRAAYAAPELLAGGDHDHRADLFSASVTAYELLARQPPFPAGDRQAPPVRLATVVPAVPAQLDAAIMRGLALDPEQRWRSAAELGGRISAILVAVDAYVDAGRRRQHSSPPT